MRISRYLILFVVVLVCISTTGFAQSTVSFMGNWGGSIKVPDRDEIPIILVIEDGTFTHYLKFDDDWRVVNPATNYYEQLGDILLIGWINTGGVWTENQIFSISYVNPRKVEIVWTRHVINREEGQDGSSWNMRGEGELIKVDWPPDF